MSFDEFWAIYPRKASKIDARKAWEKLNPDEALVAQIVDHIAERVQTDPQFQDKAYIPYPATFLRGERWTDEWEPDRPKPNVMSDNELLRACQARGITTQGRTRYQLIDLLENSI